MDNKMKTSTETNAAKPRAGRRKKRVIGILLSLLIAGILLMGGMMTAVFVSEKTERPLAKADVIIVLGARVMGDGTLSTTLEYRIETAYKVYEQGYADHFILCGAQGSDEPISEARAMAAYLQERGVPPEKIYREDESYNTQQNLINALAYMDGLGMERALLVTSDYHVARALALCEDIGIQASGVAAPGPDLWHNRMKARFRESLSWIYYRIFGWR